MQISFTKMQGAGNDFVVLDETQTRYGLTAEHYRFLADRHFGVGADQILTVRPSSAPDIDFSYLIHNADGAEAAHCGNGARCFLIFVRRQGLTTKDQVTVQTLNRVLQLQMQPDGRVTVDMQAPDFDLGSLPFVNKGQHCELIGSWINWPLTFNVQGQEAIIKVVLVSMGNPHAVTLVDDVDTAPVLSYGPLLQGLSAFPRGVNVGFMQVLDRSHIRLRVYERGAGETLACGTGACAAVVAGIRLGLLDATVDVQTQGGVLTISWQGSGTPVMLTGPASVVFDGEIDLPELKASMTLTKQFPSAMGNQITEDDIANYLANTPDFFERHAELLAGVQLFSPHSQRAVSLQERQATLLREKIRLLEQRVMDMIRHVNDNTVLSDKLLQWAQTLFLNADPQVLPQLIADELANHFSVPQVGIKVWGVAAQYQSCSFATGVSDDAMSFATSLAEPFCGVNTGLEAIHWLPNPQAAVSLAILPLRPSPVAGSTQGGPAPAFGLLVLASPDAQRFNSTMRTDFLVRIAQLASAALAPLR